MGSANIVAAAAAAAAPQSEQQQEDATSALPVHSEAAMLGLRTSLTALNAVQSHTLIDLVYPRWEHHLLAAMNACAASPGSPLLVSDRSLPPLFLARPEIHQQVVAVMDRSDASASNATTTGAGDAASATAPAPAPRAKSDYAAAATEHLTTGVTLVHSPVASASATPLSHLHGGNNFSSSDLCDRGGLFGSGRSSRPRKANAELHNKVLSVLSRVKV